MGPKLRPQEGGEIQDGRLKHSYQREGQFQFTMRVRDSRGHARTYTAEVTVISLPTFDAELRALWNEFKTLLRRWDVASALNCIHSASRSGSGETLQAVLKTGKPIDQILTDIQLVEFKGQRTEYQMLRTDERGRLSYLVLFAVDIDGRWRLRSF